EHAQAQSSSSGGSAGSAGSAESAGSAGPAPTTPTQSPTVNPSSPNTVQQPSSTTPSTSTSPSAPSTTPSAPSGSAPSGRVTGPADENTPSTTAPSERRRSVAKTPSLRNHFRSRPGLVTYSCSYLGCVRTYPWAFPCQYYSRYCYPLGYYRPLG